MQVRVLDYSRYHGRGNVGSTRLRVKQLQKYWPKYQDYKYGENPDVMVFQKVYVQPDWRFIEHFENLKILDICDPDWLDQQNIKQTVDAVDGIVCPTEPLAEFIRQLADKPVKVIPDRHDIEGVALTKVHKGQLKSAVWFGYSQHAELLQYVVPVLYRKGIALTIISNENPYADRWAEGLDYTYKRFNEETILDDLAQYDICLLPKGTRPQDRFKSNNKTTLAWLAGIPVVTDDDELEAMKTAEARNKQAKLNYDLAIKEYDVKISVREMKEFIEELRNNRTKLDKTTPPIV